MKMLTLIETEEIDDIVKNHLNQPENREWQKILAFKVVEIIHWTKEAELSEKISNFMFWNVDKLEILKSLDDEELNTFKDAMWWFKYSEENLFETIVKSWLESSNSNSRNSVKSGAIYINEEKIDDFNFDVSANFIDNKFMLIRKWKKNFRIILK
jgi:tyrosyl-tRNA synthetase